MPTTHHLRSAVFSLLLIGSVCCNKDSGPSPNGTLEIVSDLSMANVQNGVQAVHTTADQRYKTYFYGSFNDKGVAAELKEVNMHKPEGDSSINMFLDSAQRIKYLFISAKGIKANELIVFDYNQPGKTVVRVMSLDFNGSTSKVIYQTVVDNSTLKTVSETRYASMTGGLLHLLNVMTTGVDLFDGIVKQIGGFWTQVAFRVVITIGATGCILTAPVGIGVLCATAGYILIRPIRDAFADPVQSPLGPVPDRGTPVSSPPSDAKPSPSKQTENTQLQQTLMAQGGFFEHSFNFGGGQHCSLIGIFSSAILTIKVNKAKTSVLEAVFTMLHKENKLDVTCAPWAPGYALNQHNYQMAYGTIAGDKLSVWFRYLSGAPSCAVSFTGTIYGKRTSGVLTIDRNDGVTGTIDYVQNIPIVLDGPF